MRNFLISVLVLTALAVPNLQADSAEDDVAQDLVIKYLAATTKQQEKLRGTRSMVDIAGSLPKLAKVGKLHALRHMTKIGKITYKSLGFQGDGTIKNEVIGRYLSAEMDDNRDNRDIAITPDNYKFKLKSSTYFAGRRTYVFQLTPKSKKVGLFKGELWLDGETAMPVKETGQLVKSPSIFLRKVEFVRDYELKDGVSYPAHLASTVETRLFGKAELEINFTDYEPDNGSDEDEASVPVHLADAAN